MISIPAGTIARLIINASLPPSEAIPIDAGMMVVGMVPKIPPTTPPYFSISTVTVVATIPAIKAATNTVCSSMLVPTDNHQ